MPVKPCLVCGALSTGSRCPAHALPKARGGSTRAWRRVRAQVLDRDGHTCQLCGRPAFHADHVHPKRDGGTDHPDNLRALCAACNLRRGAG